MEINNLNNAPGGCHMPMHSCTLQAYRCFAVLCGMISIAAPQIVAAQIVAAESEEAATSELPIGNDAFKHIVTRGRITQRFEIYNPRSADQLQKVKEMGFNQVILDWPNLHPQATAIGLDVVMANWWSLETEDSQIQEAVEEAKKVDPRHLSAVSMMDEPERYATDTPFSYYKSLYGGLRSHFDEELPGVKLEISHWGPLESWTRKYYDAFVPLYQSADRMRLMPYPDLNEGPLGEVYYQMLRSRHVMQLAGRDIPQVVILQTWALADKKLPTIGELRVMAYLALLGGADTLSFFSYDPELWDQTDGFTEAFAGLMRELVDFSDRYRDAVVESSIRPNGVLTALVEFPNGRQVSLRINSRRESVDGLEALAVIESSYRCRDDSRRRSLRSTRTRYWLERCRPRFRLRRLAIDP